MMKNKLSLAALTGTLLASLFSPSATAALFGVDILTDQLVRIDRDTGAATTVGALGFDKVNGLAYDSTSQTLYGVDNTFGAATVNDPLLTINTSTGAATEVGFTGTNAGSLGLAFDSSSGTLIGLIGNPQRLVDIDLGSGAASVIGPVSTVGLSLAYDPGTDRLYTVDLNTDELFSINKSTLATSLIGALDPSANLAITGLTFDSSNNTLYGIDNTSGNDRLLAIDTLTGTSTFVGNTGFDGIRGLVFIDDAHLSAVPSPGAVALFGLGLMGLLGWRRRFSH